MSRRENEFDHGVVTETKKKLKKPPLYKVLLHNDDYTTKEFVVQVLSMSSTKSVLKLSKSCSTCTRRASA